MVEDGAIVNMDEIRSMPGQRRYQLSCGGGRRMAGCLFPRSSAYELVLFPRPILLAGQEASLTER